MNGWQLRLLGPVDGHRVPLAHAPQLATVRAMPQRSVVLMLPQPVFVSAHSSASVCGVQPHWFAAPAPAHVLKPVHEPQLVTLRGLPHVSVPDSGPHWAPSRAQNCAFVSAGQLHEPAMHWFTPVQVPQLATLRVRPQLSVPVAVPQLTPRRVQNWASVSGVQAHWPAVHVFGAVQVPQLTVRAAPQLSMPDSGPHAVLCRAQNWAFVSG